MNIHQVGSELALDEVAFEIFVENAHDLHERGHKDLGELPENLLRDELVGERGDGGIGVVQRGQNAAKQDRLQLNEVFLRFTNSFTSSYEEQLGNDAERVNADSHIHIDHAIRDGRQILLDDGRVSAWQNR